MALRSGVIVPGARASRQETPIEPLEKLRHLVNAAIDKKAADVVVLDLTGKTSFCDYFVVMSGNNQRHVRAIASHLVDAMRREHGVKPLGTEGLEAGRWALLDYDDVLVHIFEAKSRAYYDLEGLWLDAGKVSLASLGAALPEAPLSDAEYAARLP